MNRTMRPGFAVVVALSASVGLATVGALPGQETVRHEYRFGAESPSRSVEVDLPYAGIRIEGWIGDSVRVELTPEGPRTRELPPVTLADGRLTLADLRNQELLEVLVRAPRDANVRVRGSNGRDVTVVGMHGDLEIENSNAGILIEGSRSGVAASTSNGPIVVRVERMPDAAPMSFLTSNDSIRIVLPADADARLLLETDNAAVRSEFDVAQPPDRAPAAPGHPQTLQGRIGDGGAVIRARTDNGDIILVRGPDVPPPASGD